jgi:ubiquinone/menaquinone biosynthesis C-methylase UbiE
MQRLEDRPELLDGPLDDLVLLRGNLRDLRRVNRWLGGVALSRSALVALVTKSRSGRAGLRADLRERPVTMLDIGTGSADIPVALVEWTARRGLQLRVEAIDERHEVVDFARGVAAATAAVELQVADGPPLPYRSESFDIAHASMVTHHLEPPDLAAFLAEMRRVSRVGVIVNDLHRGWFDWIVAWVLSRTLTRNAMTRNDAPLSVRRAYRADEIAAVAQQVGLDEVARFKGFLGHRYALVFAPMRPPAGTGPDGSGRPSTWRPRDEWMA